MIFIACSLEDSQKLSCNLYLCIRHAFYSMFINDNIIYIEKPDGICSPNFVVNDFSELVLHQSSVNFLSKIQGWHK